MLAVALLRTDIGARRPIGRLVGQNSKLVATATPIETICGQS